MRGYRFRTMGLGATFAVASYLLIGYAEQLPMEPIKESGQAVFPVYEGWYKNPDGSFTFLVGYFNRNSKQTLDIPVGPNNRVEPGGPEQGQPTHFEPRRAWGVFTIKVPSDFGTKKLTWTIVANGQTASVPMHLDPNWYVEPFEDTASKNRPPTLGFEQGGSVFEGPPDGIAASLRTGLSEPLSVTLWATDKKPTTNLGLSAQRTQRAQREGREATPRLTISWFKFRGPGEVTFSNAKPEVEAGGTATTTATFSKPGEYILRVQANDETGEGGGGFQCCWTNALVKVRVDPAAITTVQ